MSVMNTNVEAFCPLLETELKDLPELVFDDSITGLASSIATLGDLVEDELSEGNVQEVGINDADDSAGGEDQTFLIANQVIKAYSKLKNDPKYASNFSAIYSCAAALGSNIAQTFSILRDQVKPKTLKLKDRIKVRADEIMKEQGISLREMSYKPNFKVIRWNDYYSKLGGWSAIQTAMTAALGYEPSPSASSLRAILQKLELEPEQLDLNEEAVEDIKERTSTDATEEQKEVIDEVIETATDRYTFKKMLAETAQAAIDSTNLLPILEKCDHILGKFNSCFSKMKHTQFNLAGPVAEKLSNNFKMLENAILAVAYTVGVIDNYYSKSYVLGESTLNGDNESTDADEANKQEEQAMKYIRARYLQHNIALPSSGITMEEIKEDEEATEEMYAALIEDNKHHAKEISTKLLMQAAEEELTEYLDEEAESNPPADTTPEEFKYLTRNKVNSALYQFDHGAMNLETVLYNFVIDVYYPQPAVQKAHAMFGPEVIKQMELNQDLDEDTLKLIDTSVGASLISECIVQNFLKKV